MTLSDQALIDLATTLVALPTQRDELEKQCALQGWKQDRATFTISDTLFLRAYFTSPEKNSAIYSLCAPLFFWETWEPENYKDLKTYKKDAKQFTETFHHFTETLTASFGAPITQGKKANYDKETRETNGWLLIYYHYAVWQVGHAMIVLQQCERDASRGIEISLWIVPARTAKDLPPLPIKISRVYDGYQ